MPTFDQLKKAKDKEAGKIKNSLSGEYESRVNAEERYYVKDADDFNELFCELLAGKFIEVLFEESCLDATERDSFICADVIPCSQSKHQWVLIQPFCKMTELHRTFHTTTRAGKDRSVWWELMNKTVGRNPYQALLDLTQVNKGFYQTFMISLLMGDYSPHSSNYGIRTDAERFVRFDFGAAFRSFCLAKGSGGWVDTLSFFSTLPGFDTEVGDVAQLFFRQVLRVKGISLQSLLEKAFNKLPLSDFFKDHPQREKALRVYLGAPPSAEPDAPLKVRFTDLSKHMAMAMASRLDQIQAKGKPIHDSDSNAAVLERQLQEEQIKRQELERQQRAARELQAELEKQLQLEQQLELEQRAALERREALALIPILAQQEELEHRAALERCEALALEPILAQQAELKQRAALERHEALALQGLLAQHAALKQQAALEQEASLERQALEREEQACMTQLNEFFSASKEKAQLLNEESFKSVIGMLDPIIAQLKSQKNQNAWQVAMDLKKYLSSNWGEYVKGRITLTALTANCTSEAHKAHIHLQKEAGWDVFLKTLAFVLLSMVTLGVANVISYVRTGSFKFFKDSKLVKTVDDFKHCLGMVQSGG